MLKSGNDFEEPSLKIFIEDIFDKLGFRFAFLVAVSAICAVTDGMRILTAFLLVPFLGLPLADQDFGYIADAERLFQRLGISYEFWTVAGLVFCAFTLQAVVSLYQSWCHGSYTHYYTMTWRKKLFEALVKARWEFLIDRRRGEFTNALSQETASLSQALAKFIAFLSNLLVVIVYFSASLLISFETTLIMIAVGIILVALNQLILGKILKNSKIVVKGNNKMMQLAQEFFANIKGVKAAPTSPHANNAIAAPLEQIYRGERRGFMIPPSTTIAAELLAIFALLLAVSSIEYIGSESNATDLAFVLLLFLRAQGKISATMTNLQHMFRHLPSYKYVEELYVRTKTAVEHNWGVGRIVDRRKVAGKLEFRNASLSYGEKFVLEDINVQLNFGTVVALVGKSGSGKTSFVDTLLQLIELNSGNILLNGQDISGFEVKSWRKNIGYVSQDSTLINGTIAENLRLFTPNATDEMVIQASRSARAHDFIMSLERGYDTRIGEMGSKLSGGQRQRISIARALLQDPPILILDEATSALDHHTEQEVMTEIYKVRDSRLVVLIAHRLNTIQRADQIIILDNGKIIDSGSWAKLQSRNSFIKGFDK